MCSDKARVTNQSEREIVRIISQEEIKEICNCNVWKNDTHTFGLAMTSTWSTSLRKCEGSLAWTLVCSTGAAPLKLNPPPINRMLLYILRFVSSLATQNHPKYKIRIAVLCGTARCVMRAACSGSSDGGKVYVGCSLLRFVAFLCFVAVCRGVMYCTLWYIVDSRSIVLMQCSEL